MINLSAYDDSCEKLVDAHLEWTLDIAMDEASGPAETESIRPLVLSPFLASEAPVIASFLTLLPGLGPDDCILDIG